MLREGLRQELPELFELWARRPQLRVPRTHPALAALAGLGAQWLSRSILRGALLLSASVTGFPAVRTFEVTEVLSWALGTVVAFASGGRRGLALLIVSATSLAVLRVAVTAPGVQLFCERAGLADCPDDPLKMLASAWPIAAGIALGTVARRAISSGPPGTMGLALGAGIVAVVGALSGIPVLIFVPDAAASESIPAASIDFVFAAQVTAAAAMGLIAGRFTRRAFVAGIVIATAYLLSFLAFLPGVLEHPPPADQMQWQVFMPVLLATAALLGLALGRLRRRVKVTG